MHELSIALGLVEAAQEEAERLHARVSAVHLRLGALSGVVPEALLSSRTKRVPSFTRNVAWRAETKASSWRRMAPRLRPTTQPVTGSL